MNKEFLLVFGVLTAFFGPFVSIWSINTLFGTGIDYNFTTWCAIFWLQLLIANKFQ